MLSCDIWVYSSSFPDTLICNSEMQVCTQRNLNMVSWSQPLKNKRTNHKPYEETNSLVYRVHYLQHAHTRKTYKQSNLTQITIIDSAAFWEILIKTCTSRLWNSFNTRALKENEVSKEYNITTAHILFYLAALLLFFHYEYFLLFHLYSFLIPIWGVALAFYNSGILFYLSSDTAAKYPKLKFSLMRKPGVSEGELWAIFLPF